MKEINIKEIRNVEVSSVSLNGKKIGMVVEPKNNQPILIIKKSKVKGNIIHKIQEALGSSCSNIIHINDIKSKVFSKRVNVVNISKDFQEFDWRYNKKLIQYEEEALINHNGSDYAVTLMRDTGAQKTLMDLDSAAEIFTELQATPVRSLIIALAYFSNINEFVNLFPTIFADWQSYDEPKKISESLSNESVNVAGIFGNKSTLVEIDTNLTIIHDGKKATKRVQMALMPGLKSGLVDGDGTGTKMHIGGGIERDILFGLDLEIPFGEAGVIDRE